MKVSHNEVLTLCSKSFEGLGFSPGETADAAEMVAWLEAHGVAVLAQVCDALPTLSPETEKPLILDIKGVGALVDAQGGSALFWGPLLVEWGVMKALEGGAVTMEVHNYRHPIMLLGLVARYARRGVGMEIRWGGELAQSTVCLSISPDKTYPVVMAGSMETMFRIESNEPLMLSFAAERARIVDTLALPLFVPTDFAESFNHQRNNGIEIEDAHWKSLNHYAKNILVEATDESRRRGAGESGG